MKRAPILAILAMLISLLLVLGGRPAVAAGALSSTPDEQVWVTNGPVYAAAIAPDGTTYIGGDFSYVGPRTGSGVALDAASGARDTAFPLVEGSVSAVAADGAGGYYIGGDFTKVGGLTRNELAHILADGSVDPTFDPNANDYVSSPRRLGLDRLRRRLVHLHRRPEPQPHRRPGCEQRRRHRLGPRRGRLRLRPGRLGRDRLRRRRLHHHRRPDPQLHRRPRMRPAARATAWDPDANGDVSALAVSGSTVYAGGDF